jgi:hypothetical protein
MSVDELLRYEASVRMRQAGIAVAAAVLLFAAPVIGLTGIHTSVDELTLDLLTIHKRFPLDLVAAVIQAFGLFALASTLGWLDGRSLVRSPQVKTWVRWVAIGGALLFALGIVGSEALASSAANKFAKDVGQTYLQANSLTSGGLIAIFPLVEQLGALLLTGGFIYVSLTGMRTGVLPRYMGYTGIIAGALVLFPIVPVPVVQSFWLIALAILFAGRWPTGEPPAWTTGTAVPWLSNQPARGAGGGGGGLFGGRARAQAQPQPQPQARGRGRGQREPEPEVVEADDTSSSARTRANTPKRKRKRRH